MSEISNEYLSWVHFAVPGMLAPQNITAMNFALTNMPEGKPLIEIGSFCGLSTVVLCYLLDKHPGRGPLFTCDKWQFEGQQLGVPLADSPSLTHDKYQAFVKDTYLRVMQTFASHKLPHTIESLSDEFFHRWFSNEQTTDVFGQSVTLGGEIGFCYVDGDHTYDAVTKDFENTDRVLVPGGFILFDDSADTGQFEVNRLTKEIASGTKYELISKNPNYLFRKR